MSSESQQLILYIEKPQSPELQRFWVRDWLWKPNRELALLRQRTDVFIKRHEKSSAIPAFHFIRPHQNINMSADSGSIVYGRATVWNIDNPDDGPGQQIKFIEREQGGKRVFADCYTSELGMKDDAKLQTVLPKLRHGGYYDVALLWMEKRPREPEGYKNIWVNDTRYLAIK
jgi:hypothetical protein